MEKMMTVTISKSNGDFWKHYTNVPKSAIKIVDGFVTIDLDDVCIMLAIHNIGDIVCREQ